MASDWSCLLTAGLPGPRNDACCVMKAAPLQPCLVSTYALRILHGHAASLTDGHECNPAKEPVCAVRSQLWLDSFPRMLHLLKLPSKKKKKIMTYMSSNGINEYVNNSPN